MEWFQKIYTPGEIPAKFGRISGIHLEKLLEYMAEVLEQLMEDLPEIILQGQNSGRISKEFVRGIPE